MTTRPIDRYETVRQALIGREFASYTELYDAVAEAYAAMKPADITWDEPRKAAQYIRRQATLKIV